MADDRTYIRLHDGMPGHPKVRGLSDKAFRTLIRAWCYCSEYLTDGEVVSAVARDLGTSKGWTELVSAGLAESAPGGYLMHDYLEHQRSAAEVAEIKAGRGAGGTLGNHVRWHVQRRKPDPTCEHCNPPAPIANGSQERWDSESDGTSQGNRSGSHSQRQIQIQIQTENSLQGGSHVSSGSPATPPRFPDHCQQHADDPTPGKCGLCADVRKARAAMPRLALVVSDRPEWCGSCNEFTRLIDSNGDGPSRRCTACHPLALEASA